MLNIVIPMSGRGSRFADAGYTFPKPLIEVNNKPMIQLVVDNLNFVGRYIFIVLKEHYDRFALKYLLPLICGKNQCEIVIVEDITEGAACTCLLAKKFIDNDDELIIANSDQYIDFDSTHFLKFVHQGAADVGILTFHATHPKWSFAKIDDNSGLVIEVAEKKPISTNATCGVYYWAHGKDFVSSAEQMIKENTRVNNEFYVAPTINILISQNKRVISYMVPRMLGLGTPEDLQKFLNIYNDTKR